MKAPMICCEHLATGYGDRPLMGDVNLTIHQGEIVFLLGSSGCGKSTLMKHMIGLLPPLGGEVYVRGLALSQMDDETRAATLRSVGIMYQGGALFGHLTVLENVLLPMLEFAELPRELCEISARIKLAQVGMLAHCDAMPSTLSGGQKKRAAIARALALEPQVLFLDEPSAGLDPVTSAQLDALIFRLSRELGKTVIIISHELASIEAIADTVIYLDRTVGGVLDQGPPKVLREQSPAQAVRDFFARHGERNDG
jgi:phospholipid/cholesterol/gamma-HCH transport system ATP-binding protein